MRSTLYPYKETIMLKKTLIALVTLVGVSLLGNLIVRRVTAED